MEEGRYILGNTYYHYANPAEEIGRNFELMKDYGINMVRTNEIWPGWSVTETDDGVYCWDALDDYLDQAEKHGMSVCLGIGINDTPGWLYRKLDGLRFREWDGSVSSRRVQSADFNDERYRIYMKRFIIALVTRYRFHPGVACWQFGNEIRYNVKYCDSEGTRIRFRQWLRTRFGTIEQLNREWGSFYREFEEIYPYKSIEGEPTEGNTVHCINTILFQDWSIAELIGWGIEIVKQYSQKPVFHNNFNTPEHNHWEMARPCDLVCVDIYASTYVRPGYYNGLLIDTAASIARQQAKPWWVGETSAGQYGTYNRRAAAPELIELCVMEQIASGSSAIFYFRHKAPKWEQPHKFTGSQTVYRRDETPLPYLETCIHIRDFILDFETMLWKGSQPEPKIGVYFPCLNIQFGEEAGYGKLALDSAGGARAVWNCLGLPVELLSDSEMTISYLKKFDLIHIPVCYLLSDTIGEALKEYVAFGGKLIVEARAAYVNQYGLLYRQQPGASLAEVCGVKEDQFFEIENQSIRIEKGAGFWGTDTITAGSILQTLRLCGAEAVARDCSGHITAAQNNYGNGWTLYLGFAPSLDFFSGPGKYPTAGERSPERDSRDEKLRFFAAIAEKSGLKRPVSYRGWNSEISVRYIRWDQKWFVFFFNYGSESKIISFDEPVSVYGKSGFEPVAQGIEIRPASWTMVKAEEKR